MSKFKLLSSSIAASLGLGASTEDPNPNPDAAPAPGEGDGEGEEEQPAGDPPADPAAPAPAPEAATGETLTLAQGKEAVAIGRAEGVAAGVAAERDRTAKVLGSKEGLANAADAGFMLANTDATADKIISHLASKAPMPAASAAAPIENTNLNLSDPTNPAASAAGKEAGGNVWDESHARIHGSAAFVVPPANAVPPSAGAVIAPPPSGF